MQPTVMERTTADAEHVAARSFVIGVVAPDRQSAAVAEFFQLFKAPWAFARGGNSSAAVIVSGPIAVLPDSPLVIVFGHDDMRIDHTLGLSREVNPETSLVTYQNRRFCVHGSSAALSGAGKPIGPVDAKGRSLGRVCTVGSTTVVRLGYDLFEEVERLLWSGQKATEAFSPAVEIHISIVRDVLLANGVPVIELPPQPYGYPFIACLTHDIDFMGIRHHGLDRSVFGFAYRVFRSVITARKGDWRAARSNLAALLSLPAVYLRRKADFWYPFDRYAEVEGSLPSTFFLIPFRGRRGVSESGADAPRLRAAAYDVKEYAADLHELAAGRAEVGVHGIDAWRDPAAACDERDVIHRIVQRDELGIRMHWLYFSDQTPSVLEEARYSYDSTCGFNDAVGYRNGTTQVFRPKGASRLLELPLHIQDTALLFPNRMHLSDDEALQACRQVIGDMTVFGGALTINWHDRSLAPERNWDRVYVSLLEELRAVSPWFAQAGQAVTWFRRRRSCRFGSIEVKSNQLLVTLLQEDDTSVPVTPGAPLCVRVTWPAGVPEDRHAEAAIDSMFVVDTPANGTGTFTVGLPY